MSTIGEEKRNNPRLQVKSVDEYVALMNNLNLPNPKMMDVAVPANMHIGLAQDAVAQKGWAFWRPSNRSCGDADAVSSTFARHPSASAMARSPARCTRPTGTEGQSRTRRVARAASLKPPLVFYCAYGERSAMAVQAAQDAGIGSARHIQGGIAAWKDAGGSLEP